MKKILILSIFGMLIFSNNVYAVVNAPSAPSYKTNTTTKSNSSNSKYKKNTTYTKTPTIPKINTNFSTAKPNSIEAELDNLAMLALKEAEKRNQSGMQNYIKQMMNKGVNEMFQPQIIAKRTPQCPPIRMELNGMNLSGSLCAKFGYIYNNEERWVGYCK